MTEPIRLSIFHTNDMHGRLAAMSRLSSFARRLRTQAASEGREVFFWDAGDAADRSVRLVSITKGAAFSPILNAMGYTLQTIGNDIALPYGPQTMAAVAARAVFPILGANFRDGSQPPVEGLREYAIVPLNSGLKMGVIGVTAPWGGGYEVFGLHMPEYEGVIRSLIGTLRAKGAALIIILSHLGLSADRLLAESVSGIDLIVGAHTHDRLPTGEERNGVLIAQAGQYAEALGRIDLTLDVTGKVLARCAQVIDVPGDEAPDPAVEEAIRQAEQEVEGLMARPLGTLKSPLDLNYFEECSIGNFAADALRERMKTDAAMVSSGIFHQGLPEGEITLGQLNAACFMTANPGVTEMRGEQLLRTLERGLDPAIAEEKPGGFRGTPVGLPQLSGMVVQFDQRLPAGQRVRRVLVGDQPLDPECLYRIAHTDAEVGTKPEDAAYLILGAGQKPTYEVPTIVPEVMEDYLCRHSPFTPPPNGRWQTVNH